MQPFVHLRVHSDYSLGYGALKISDIIEGGKNLQIPAIALTDRYNLFGSLEFAKSAAKAGIQPISGAIIRVAYGQNRTEPLLGELLLLAQNEHGHSRLLELSSKSYLDTQAGSAPYISLEELCADLNGIIVLCGTSNSPVGHYVRLGKWEEAESFIRKLSESAPNNLYIEIMRRGIAEEDILEEFLVDQAYKMNLPLVATNEVCFLSPNMYEAHDVFLCIAQGRYLVEEERPRANVNNYLKSYEEMAELFADLPEAVANTAAIAQRISYMPQGRQPLLPKFTNDDVDEGEELRRQALSGLEKHLQKVPAEMHEEYRKRMDYEIEVIVTMQFAGYFLIVSDFIKWSKRQGIPVGPGRGSGAGSVTAWSLEITDLDPIKFGLLFERFLNPERVSMPDFDIDFCQERRGEVIEYVKGKYGIDRVANIITFGKLQARAVLRDVGRVLQMHYNEIDRICKMVPNNPANPVTLAEAIALDKDLQALRDSDDNVAKLLAISLQLEGMNRHASTHAAGVVIADRPLVELVPLYKDQNGEIVLQYSMKMAEEAGLVKFDFLGLKTLTVIANACELLKNRGIELHIQELPLDDAPTYEMLSKGNTCGVFQFESPGMREAIKKLKPDNIGDLVALGSLYRPGPMDNIPSYINRKHGLEKPDYIHPLLEPALKETYGIIVYQEQVMEIARVLSGYTLGGADLLRRAMGKKIKSEMEAQRATFIDGAVKNGIDNEQAAEIFALVEKFASYGFNKSHAAAYAIISYQTAYLKTHYPVEFLVASINLEIDDSDKINMFCQDARPLGIAVLPPDINSSEAYCSIEDGAIRLGLGSIKNVGIKGVELILAERRDNGVFQDIFDLMERCDNCLINKRMLENFARSGALDHIHPNRRQIFENTETLLRYSASQKRERDSQQQSFFDLLSDNSGRKDSRQELPVTEPWGDKAVATAEFESMGFYLSAHPLEQYTNRLKRLHISDLATVESRATEKGFKTRIAGTITSRKIRSSARGKYAFLQLSDLSGLLEVSIFNENLLYQHNDLLQVGRSVCMEAEVRRDNNGMRVFVEKIWDIEEALKAVKSCYNVYISDTAAIEKIAPLISDSGVLVKLFVKLDNTEVSFKSKGPIYINHQDISALYSYPGVEIKEAS